MASNQVACIGQYQACAIRVARLDSTCAPLGGATDVVVTDALVTATITPDVEEGTKFEPKTACGKYPFVAEAEDVIKRWNVDMQLAVWDLEFLEVMTGSPLLIGDTGDFAGKVIGFESRGPNSPSYNGASVEIFTKTSGNGGVCGEASELPPFMRHILPRFKGRLGERTFEDGVAFMRITGVSTTNSEWGTGPVPAEWEAVDPLSTYTGYAGIFATELPTVGCGYVTAT